MPELSVLATLLRETNLSLWAIEPVSNEMDLKPFLRDLYGYARNFNMTELAKDIGVSRNTVWRILKRGSNLRVATLLKLLYYMGLRVRIEQDPIPRRLAYQAEQSPVGPGGRWQL